MHINIKYRVEKSEGAVMIAEDIVNDIKKVLNPIKDRIEKERPEITLEFGGAENQILVSTANNQLMEDINRLLVDYEISS